MSRGGHWPSWTPTLRARLLLLTLLPMLATIALVMALDYRARSHFAERDLEQRTRAVIAALDHDIARLTYAAPDRSLVLDINDRLAAFPFIERLAIFASDGTATLAYQKPAWSRHPPLAHPTELGAHISRGQLVIASGVGGFATVLVQANRASVAAAKASALLSSFTLALLLALVGMVAVTRLQRTISRRLLSLEHTANDVVRTRDYSLRAEDDKEDELDHIAAALNTLLSTVEATLATLHDREEKLRVEMAERAAAQDNVRRVERQLHDAQKLDSLGRLAGGIAHDFNNLLSVIQGQAELLDAKHPGSGASVIANASQRAAELTGQLLSFSKTAAVELRHVDLHSLFGELERLMTRVIPSHITLHFDLADDLWGVHADAGRLQQVLLNLTINAKDAMPGGGDLFISAANQVSTMEGPDAGFVQIVFRDTGTGMAPETLRQALEPFFSTKGAEGTGLGLAVAHGIIQQFGGTLNLESTVGDGTSVEVRLPWSTTEKRPPLVLDDWHTATKGSGTLLLVDDQEEVRTVTEQILSITGYRVLTAVDAADALTQWDTHKEEISLVITDMVMPKMSGIELIKELRRDRAALAVILISGHAPEARIQGMKEDQNFIFLSKPYRAAILLDAVGSLLEPEPEP